MSKYIDQDKTLEYIIYGVVGKDITCGELKRAIESLPTIEIVHCRDCRHNNREIICDIEENWCEIFGSEVASDNFCSYGERQIANKIQKSKLESDTISRQSAIDMVGKYYKSFVYESDADELIVELEMLPPSEPVCEDAISRADAIEAVRSANPKDEEYHYYKHIAVEALSSLPPAEPKIVCEDTINRADAIEEIALHDSTNGTEPFFSGHEVIDILKCMPPSESQRPKGKWIRNGNGTCSCSLCQSWIPEEQHYYARFCLHCGASMEARND